MTMSHLKIILLVLLAVFTTSCVDEQLLPYDYDRGSFGIVVFERGSSIQPLQVVFRDDRTVKVDSKLQLSDFYQYQLDGNSITVEPQSGTNADVKSLEIEFIDKNTIRLYCDIKFNYDMMGGSNGPSFRVNGDTYKLRGEFDWRDL